MLGHVARTTITRKTWLVSSGQAPWTRALTVQSQRSDHLQLGVGHEVVADKEHLTSSHVQFADRGGLNHAWMRVVLLLSSIA